ncbi:MAG TPA: glutamate racemase, partial [Spirochaetia bacterium]|nr:glutamate racemase [Spirochaetia bacterium]
PEPVAFLDSGVGGLPYLAHARAFLPGRRLVYVADRANFPYGEKSKAEIVEAALSVAARLVERERPSLVVVACNTMSVAALSELRGRFSVPFVGVVPAVKPAASLSRRKRVGVLATRQTVEGEYLHALIARHAAGCDVVSLASGPLVEFVEKDLYKAGQREREDRVRQEVERFTSAGIDALVLGCTHFLHLEEEFRRQLDCQGIELVDSRDGVSRQARRVLAAAEAVEEAVEEEDAGHAPATHPGSGGNGGVQRAADVLYVTGARPLEDRYPWFAAHYGLQPHGGP